MSYDDGPKSNHEALNCTLHGCQPSLNDFTQIPHHRQTAVYPHRESTCQRLPNRIPVGIAAIISTIIRRQCIARPQATKSYQRLLQMELAAHLPICHWWHGLVSLQYLLTTNTLRASRIRSIEKDPGHSWYAMLCMFDAG